MKKEIVGDDNILNIVNEIEKLLSKGENNETIENLKKTYPEYIKELEEENMGENDFKFLKTGLPDEWKDLGKKLAYPYE